MLSSMRSRTRMWLAFCSERLLFYTSRSFLLSLGAQRAATSQQKKRGEKDERSAGIRSKSTAPWRGEIHKVHPSSASPLLALPALRSDALPAGQGHGTAQLGGVSCLRESQHQLKALWVSEWASEWVSATNMIEIKQKNYILKVLFLFTLNSILLVDILCSILVSTT